MKTKINKVSLGQIGIKGGALIYVALLLYFLFIENFDLIGSPIAWSFNFIILFAGLYFVYRYYRSQTSLNVEYFQGLLLGSLTSVISSVAYASFVFIDFTFIAPDELALLEKNWLFMGSPMTAFTASGATLIEGLSSGLMISFILMQYYKSGFKQLINLNPVELP
ncbi:MAG: hypothetical protein IPP51_07960 [Bacteroidetes bacterium]|nr:hypothetical protein [Bacteroidota bacterium]